MLIPRVYDVEADEEEELAIDDDDDELEITTSELSLPLLLFAGATPGAVAAALMRPSSAASPTRGQPSIHRLSSSGVRAGQLLQKSPSYRGA